MTKKGQSFVAQVYKEKIMQEGRLVKGKIQVIYGGKKIRDARLKAGIVSQNELADRTGIAPNIISDLERGQRSMSPTWAKLIAEALGIYSTDLLE
jgi:ribosome-binding protein aMBF1 (putative translation factor)